MRMSEVVPTGEIVMVGFLSRSIRDAQGRIHKPGEPVVVMRQLSRADFDSTQLVVVRFRDESVGALFSNEIELEAQRLDVAV